ncbi:DUF2860 domain-containing protein [Agarivorans sp. TSD2052]|uniref:DUF2860 domain-containing protein n=1 Tax=Agarivorans sp. TSD2052 TaxID=2937286 RepID=UPI00200CFC8D|nr:DUF2860 domain-containing protein [Agarivorans sp. TSD2052]UPW18283.1 DUF2860 domain-containing protein [Agarivorans sp. TSD2052]
MFKRVSSLVCCSMLLSVAADARPLAEESGWSATINLNVGYVSGQNQFSTDDDNKITKDLNNNGQSSSSVIVYPLVRVDYTTEDLKNQFFLGNSRENLGRAQFQYELGYTRALSDRSKITAAYFPELPFMNDTWSDPYDTNVARQETDENYQGGRIRYEAIADGPLTLEYAYAKRTVDNEQSGVALFGANSSEAQALNRNADLHRVIAETFVPLSRKWFLSPALLYTTAKADGSANDFDQYALRLNSLYRSGQHLFTVNAEYGQTKYSGSNPVFDNQTQKDDKISLFAIYVYQQPFGWENAMFNILGGYNDTDSNITFYDSKGGIAAFGFGYKF